MYLIDISFFFVCLFVYLINDINLEMILQMSMKESSSSRTLNSLFLILSLNDFFGSSLRELGISFHNSAIIGNNPVKGQDFNWLPVPSVHRSTHFTFGETR